MKFRWRRICTGLGVFLALNLAAVTWAEAQVDEVVQERGLELGRRLFEASSLMDAFEGQRARGRAGAAHEMVINGAHVAIHSGSVRRSDENQLAMLVERVRRNCRARGTRAVDSEEVVQAPLLEWVGKSEAFVYCLKTERALSLGALKEAFEALSKSGDLAQLGTFQGAYFRAGRGSISILTAEIQGGLVPGEMFPTDGDSPGRDLKGPPKPSGRRILSVGHNGAPALNVYTSDSDAVSNLNTYHERLVDHGFSVERARLEHGDSLALLARSAKEAFLIVGKDGTVGSQLVLARLPD